MHLSVGFHFLFTKKIPAMTNSLNDSMTDPYAPPTANLHNAPIDNSGITAAMLESLRKTKGWVWLMGIMMFVAAAFTALAALRILANLRGSSASEGAGVKSCMNF